jgi:hypothetical protein
MALIGLPSNLSPTGISYLGVQCCDEGCGENFVRFGKSSAWRQLLMAWRDRVTFINNVGAMAGFNVSNQYFYTDAVGYPDGPTILYYSSLETDGIPGPPTALNVGPNGMVGYLLARVKMHFQTNPYLELDQGTLSMSYANQDVFLDKNISTFYFNGNTSTPPIASSQIPALQVTMTTFVWEQFNLASIPTSTISAAIAAPIDQSGLFGTSTSNGGTLRLMGVDTTRRVAQNGQEMWSMRTTLVENPVGWNCVFQPKAWNGNTGADAYVPVQTATGEYPLPLDTMGNITTLVGNVSY